MVRSGKMTPAQYAAAEKAEGDTKSKSSLMARGKQLASGAMSAGKYASMATDMPKMANGGAVMGYANGGMVHGTADLKRQVVGAPNVCEYNYGPGVRSHQDYRK